MKFRLKGVATVHKKLANGRRETYRYAWRGGPRLPGLPGSPEFMAAYHEAHEARRKATEKPAVPVFAEVIDSYEASPDFLGKSAKTREDYSRYLAMIRAKYGTLPLEFFEVPQLRGDFKAWRDSMSDRPRSADYAWSVLARLCSYAVDRGMVSINPCQRGGRLYVADRQEKVWSEEHLLRLFAVASAEVAAVVTFALWTGQRQADCLGAKWSDLVGGKIQVKQAKGGRRVLIPIGQPLAKLIEGLPRRAETILTNSRGRTWTTDGFKSSYATAFARAGMTDDLHFHDLRGTAITRMGLAGCTPIEIGAVTGHSTKTVDDILAAHYLGGRAELAEQAIEKLERDADLRHKLQTELQTGSAEAFVREVLTIQPIDFA